VRKWYSSTNALGVARESDGVGRRKFRYTGDDRHLAARGLDRGFQHCALLVGAERVVLADSPEDNQAVHAVADECGLDGLCRRKVDVECRSELGGRGREYTRPAAV
jgi:hypothetical protein